MMVTSADIRAIVFKHVDTLPYRILPFIKKYMNEGVGNYFDASDMVTRFKTAKQNTTNKLNVFSGGLVKSLIPNEKGNITKITQSGSSAELEYGTSLVYASIHEKGGFIKHKGKMPAFLFHIAKVTGEKRYAYMALSAKKKGGIQIKPRHYFKLGISAFNRSKLGLNQVLIDIVQDIQKLWHNSTLK